MTGNRPVLVVIAGPNGSGKTTITTALQEHYWTQDCLYINPDSIAEETFNGWNDDESIIKATHLAAQLREEALAHRQSIVFETVFSHESKVDFIVRAHKAGYFIRLFFICTSSPAINLARIAQRVVEGGHNVPAQKTIDRYYRSIGFASMIAAFVDRFYYYDNSIDGEKARIIFKAVNGSIAKIYVDKQIEGPAIEIMDTLSAASQDA